MKLIEEHYSDNRERLIAITVRKGLPRFLAEEIVQEAYTSALEHQTYVSEGQFDQWFGRILNNVTKDTMKRERNRGMTHTSEDVQFKDIRAAYKLAWTG